jgi:hypothetical protein
MSIKVTNLSNISCQSFVAQPSPSSPIYIYKILQSGIPSYPHSLFSIKCNCFIPLSSLITLNRLSNNSRLKIANRSFQHTAPAMWYSLPPDLAYVNSLLTLFPHSPKTLC